MTKKPTSIGSRGRGGERKRGKGRGGEKAGEGRREERTEEMGLEMLVLPRAEERVWFDLYWERVGTVSKRT